MKYWFLANLYGKLFRSFVSANCVFTSYLLAKNLFIQKGTWVTQIKISVWVNPKNCLKKMGRPISCHNVTRESQTYIITIINKLYVIILSSRPIFFSVVLRDFWTNSNEVIDALGKSGNEQISIMIYCADARSCSSLSVGCQGLFHRTLRFQRE